MFIPTEDEIRKECEKIQSQWTPEEAEARLSGVSGSVPVTTRGLSLSPEATREISNWVFLTDNEVQAANPPPFSSETVQEVSTEEELVERSYVPVKQQFGK